MQAPETDPRSPSSDQVDQRVYLRDVSWKQYEAFLEMRGEGPSPRATYLEGVLELMSPSWNHEDDKKKLARLIEIWSLQVGIPLVGAGSWTLKDAAVERGAEPDECYVVMRTERVLPPPVPDFAIEVVWTSGGLNKLEVYRLLQVPEVWIWEDKQLQFYVLEGEHYREAPRSEILPELDGRLLERFMAMLQHQAVMALRDELRS